MASRARERRLFTVPSATPSARADLLARQPLHVPQDEHRAVLEAQLEEGCLDPPGALLPARLLEWARPGRLAVPRRVGRHEPLVERLLAVTTPAVPEAPPVVALVHRDAVDPGLEAAAALEPAQHAIHLQEHLLGHVPGFLGVAEETGGQVEDHSLVEPDEPGKGRGVAGAARGHELALLDPARQGLRLERHLARAHRDPPAALHQLGHRPAPGRSFRQHGTADGAATPPATRSGRGPGAPRASPPWPVPRARRARRGRLSSSTRRPTTGERRRPRPAGPRSRGPARSPVRPPTRAIPASPTRNVTSVPAPARTASPRRESGDPRDGASTSNSTSRTPHGTKRASITIPGIAEDHGQDEEVPPAHRVGEDARHRAREDAREGEEARQERVLRRREPLLREAEQQHAESPLAEAARPELEGLRGVHERAVRPDVRHGRVAQVRHELEEAEDPQRPAQAHPVA